MKNRSLLYLRQYALVLSIITLATCSKDDEQADPSPNIIGTYVYKEGTYRECGAGPTDDDWDSDSDGCKDGDCITLTFNANGTYSEISYWTGPPSSVTERSGTFTQSGSQLSMVCKSGDCDELISEEYHVKVDGTTLELDGERKYDDGYCETVRNDIWEQQ